MLPRALSLIAVTVTLFAVPAAAADLNVTSAGAVRGLMARIIDDLLTLSQFDFGERTLQSQPLDFSDLVIEVCEQQHRETMRQQRLVDHADRAAIGFEPDAARVFAIDFHGALIARFGAPTKPLRCILHPRKSFLESAGGPPPFRRDAVAKLAEHARRWRA